MTNRERPLVMRLRPSSLDDEEFDLGIVRLTTDEQVSYLNRAARLMMDDEIDVGDPVDIIPMDEESRVRLRQELDIRFGNERGSAYGLRLRRKDSSTNVKVRVTAVPDYDADGRVTGSVGIVIDESIETAITNIHKAIDRASDASALYAALDANLREVLDYDTLTVVGVNERRTHLRRLCELPPGPVESLPTKWWPMRPFVLRMLDEFKAGPLDLGELFARPDFVAYANEDPGVAEFKARCFRYSLRLGTYQSGGRLQATVSVYRLADRPFTAADLRRVQQLPIPEVINAALAMDRGREKSFALRLLKEISAHGPDSARIARHIVELLAEHAGWDHVSLLQVDEHRERIRASVQAGRARLPEGFKRSFHQGLMGLACREKRIVNGGNLADPAWAGRHTEDVPGMRSQLVIPLYGRSQVSRLDEPARLAWLLNIEAVNREAFAEEEVSAVESLIQVAAVILDHAATLEMKTAVTRAVGDGVIHTDEFGVILSANPAAERLFGLGRDELRHRNLGSLLVLDGDDDEVAGRPRPADALPSNDWTQAITSSASPGATALVCDPNGVRGQPLQILRPDGEWRRVLLSSSVLEGDAAGRIVLLTDISQHDRIERLTQLQHGLGRITSEVRAPVALAAAFLDEMKSKAPASARSIDGAAQQAHREVLPPVFVETLDKALQQLHKAMLPLESMQRLESALDVAPLALVPVDLRALLARIIGQLPASVSQCVTVQPPAGPPLVVAASPHDLAFCLEAMLSHVLADKAQAERVVVALGWARRRFVYVRITTTLDTPCACSQERPASESTASEDDFLDRAVVSGLAARMGGRLSGGAAFRLLLRAQGEDDVQANGHP